MWLRSERTLKLLTAVLSVVVVACGTSPSPTPAAPAAWSYAGDTGPASWGTLSPDYAACSSGREQSPVDLPTAVTAAPAALDVRYRPSPARVLNNGHSIEVEVDEGGSILLDGAEYALVQFHFHAPSEHTVAGRSLPMELHVVNRSADGRLAVLGVLLEVGVANGQLIEVFEAAPAAVGEEAELEAQLDAAQLLPTDRSAYRYSGSLTTPPCTQGVSWVVYSTPRQVAASQLEAFRHMYPMNARPTQPVYERTVLFH